ncbi:MAG: glycosyltransferase family 2 protein, partial [Treponema sp.]|uniref:glycosyltransferase family 2 protein n=1 Tax=Treponema sp. TaxID=166 RepID=UPI00360AD3D9
MFSVVIPTYKRDEDLRNCLQSLKENTVGPYEVIVLHPGTESTIDLCRQFSAREICDNARKNGKRIKSLWAIINDGIRASAYDYVMYLNDDCLVLSQWDLIAKQYFGDPQLGLLVLKTKGIGLDPAFRTIPTLFDYPCANYAIINKKAKILFDEHYDWFWGDADIPLQFASMSKYTIKATTENMVIHNHRIDDTRVNNESSEKNRADENYFQTKWKDYKRKGQYLRKESKFEIYTEIVVFKIKRRIKFYLSILKEN